MARVKPHFAIPFASNSCLLHDDTFAMNRLTRTPRDVECYFSDFRADKRLETELRVMVAGDRWSSISGFSLLEHDPFERRDEQLAAYRTRVAPALARQAEQEARASVPLALVTPFFAKLARDTPRFLKRKLQGREILLVSKAAEVREGFAVDLHKGTVRAVRPDEFNAFPARIELPALILRQALLMNMFSHAGISKRVHFFATAEAMPALKRFFAILEWAEAELIPVRANFSRRSFSALLPRWREGLLYARTIFELIRGKSLPEIERQLLS